jgi:hypothetical protein
MTPVFLEVHLEPDNSGEDHNLIEIIDVLDISRMGRGRGASKGSRLLFKNGTTLNIQDHIQRIKDAMKDAGALRE